MANIFKVNDKIKKAVEEANAEKEKKTAQPVSSDAWKVSAPIETKTKKNTGAGAAEEKSSDNISPYQGGKGTNSGAQAAAAYIPSVQNVLGNPTYSTGFESSKNSDDYINANSPFAAYRITSKTGARSTGVAGASANHAGIDRAMAVGTAVSLPIDVTFYKAGYSNARGNWIEFKDSSGNILHYQHLQSYNTFKPGQTIPAGTVLAKSGNTGVGSGAHLHEEYYSPSGVNITESYWNKYARSLTASGAAALAYNPSLGAQTGNIFNVGTNRTALNGYGVFAEKEKEITPFQKYMQLKNNYDEERRRREGRSTAAGASKSMIWKTSPMQGTPENASEARRDWGRSTAAGKGIWNKRESESERFKEERETQKRLDALGVQTAADARPFYLRAIDDAANKYYDKLFDSAEEKKAKYYNGRRDKDEKYKSIEENADFSVVSDKDYNNAAKYLREYDVSSSASVNYSLIKLLQKRGKSEARDKIINALEEGAIANTIAYSKYIDKNEFAVYAYILKTQGESSAKEYLEYIKDDILKRYDEKEFAPLEKKTEELSRNSWLAAQGMNAVSSLAAIPAYAKTAARGIANLYGDEYKPMNEYDPVFSGARLQDAVSRGRLTDENGAAHEGLLRNLFEQASLGVSQSVGSGVIGGELGIYIMAGSAAGQAAYEAAQEGIDPAAAAANATVQGGLEYVTEKLPFDKMMNMFHSPKGTVKAFLAEIAKAGGVEFGEEAVNNILGNAAEQIILKDKSAFAERAKEYVKAAGGWDTAGQNEREEIEKEAAKRAFFDIYVKDTLYSGVVGALSGAAQTGAAGIAGDAVNTARLYSRSGIADAIAKTGYRIELTDDASVEGMVDKDTKTVYINSKRKNPWKIIAKHELTHILEESGKYDDFVNMLKSEMPEVWSAAEQRVQSLYERANRARAARGEDAFTLDADTLEAEAAAELGEALKTERFIRNFAVGENMPFAMRAIEFTRDMANRTRDKLGTDNGWRKAAGLWAEALNNVSQDAHGSGVRYSIYEVNGKQRIVVDRDITRGGMNINTRKAVRNFIQNNYDKIHIVTGKGNSGVIYVTDRGAKEYVYSEYSKRLRGVEKYDKFRMADNIDEILRVQIAAANYENKGHGRKDNIIGFFRTPLEIQVGKRLYSVELVTAITNKQTEEFYDIVNLDLKNKNEPRPTPAEFVSTTGRRGGDSFNNSIAQNAPTVNNNIRKSNKKNTQRRKIAYTDNSDAIIAYQPEETKEITKISKTFDNYVEGKLKKGATTASNSSNAPALYVQNDHGQAPSFNNSIAQNAPTVNNNIRKRNKNDTSKSGDVRYKLVGKTAGGIEAYETSNENEPQPTPAEFVSTTGRLAGDSFNNSIAQNAPTVNNNIRKSNNNNTQSRKIAYTVDNQPVAVIEKDFLNGVAEEDIVKTVKNELKKFKDGIPVHNSLIKVNRRTLREFTGSKYTDSIRKNNSQIYEDKMRSAANMDDIITASVNYMNEDKKHARRDNFVQFARGDVLMRIGRNDYSARVIIGITDKNNTELYDVVSFKPASFSLKNRPTRIPLNAAGVGQPVNNSVAQNAQAVNNNIRKSNKNNTPRRKIAEPETQTYISGDDVRAIQSIERKSVNDFTSEEIEKTKSFARKYFAELGSKSPFFRAWFGDWRENDKSRVTATDIGSNRNTNRGAVKNTDTGIDIYVSRVGIDHIKNHLHNSIFSNYVIAHLDEITRDAVLLDTTTSEPTSGTKHKNTLMMHSFYAVVKFGETNQILKLYVEEYYNDFNNQIARRDYDLKKIENTTDGTEVRRNSSAPLNAFNDVSEITVSDLFRLVKAFDKDFQPNDASAVVNADGTPKLVFRSPDGGLAAEDYNLPVLCFSENRTSDAQERYYIRISKPYKGDIYALAEEKGGLKKAYDYLTGQGYDGIINAEREKGYTGYIVFNPYNAKSADSNIGTFDRSNHNTRYKIAEPEEILGRYGIKDINDYIEVQKKVQSFLSENGFYSDEGGKSRTVTNKDSGMVIEINGSGIKETFGNGKRFERLGKNLKLAKLWTVEYLPQIIQNGRLLSDNISNYHNKASDVKYAYIEGVTENGGGPASVVITVRKSPQKNKFWLHQVDLQKESQEPPAGVKNSKTGYNGALDENIISQENEAVKRQRRKISEPETRDKAEEFVNRVKLDRRNRMKEFKGNKWHAQAKELQIADSIITQLIRENGGNAPKYYQLRQDIKQLQSELSGMQRDNATLKQERAFFKKRAYSLLGIYQEISSANLKSLNILGIAEELKKSCGAHMTARSIAERLARAYSKLDKSLHADEKTKSETAGEVYGAFVELAEDMLSDAELTDRSLTDEYGELINRLRLSAVRVTRTEAADIPDFDNWRKKQTGRIRISKDGTPVDQYYEQLAADYPELFDRDIINPSDRLLEIERVRARLDPIKLDTGDMDAARSLADDMFTRFFSDEMQDESGINAADALQKNYEKKRGRVIAQKNAELEYLRRELNKETSFTERLHERVLEASEEDLYENSDTAFVETDMTETLGKKYVKRLRDDGARVMQRKSKNGAVDVTYLKFDAQEASRLRANNEYRQTVTKIHRLAEEGRLKAHGEYRYRSNDVYRNFDIFFGDDAPAMKKLILDPFDDAKRHNQYFIDYYTNVLYEEIVKKNGISKGSDMSAAVQYYGEFAKTGKKPHRDDSYAAAAEKIFRRLTDPKKAGEKAAENLAKIKEADRVFREMYRGQLESINAARRAIYPNAQKIAEERELEYADLQHELDIIQLGFSTGDFEGLRVNSTSWDLLERIAIKEESSERTLHRIMDIATDRMMKYDERIEAAEAQLAATRTNTKKFDNLKERLARLIEEREAYRRISEAKERELLRKIEELKEKATQNAVSLKEGLKERAKTISSRMGEIETEMNSTEITYGREIQARENYYHHFREIQSAMSEMSGFMKEMTQQGKSYKSAAEEYARRKDGRGIDVRLAGKSEETAPKSKWQGIFQRRRGDFNIKYDAVEGMLQYIPQAAYAAAIDPEIAIFRTLKDDLAEKVNENDKNRSAALGSFGKYLNEFANDLAGKTGFLDRIIPRSAMPYLQKISSRTKMNQIMFNFSSSCAQIMNVPHALGYIDDLESEIGAMGDIFRLINSDSDFSNEMKKSQFIAERYANQRSRFEHGAKAQAMKVAGTLINILDEIGTKYIWSAAYRSGKKKGVDAVRYADDVTRRMVAGRGIGEMTILQRQKLLGMVAPFTVEAGNYWRVIGDIAREYRQDAKKRGVTISLARAVKRLMGMWAAAWLFNRIMELIRGSDGGEFDPIEDVRTAIETKAGIGGALGLISGDALSTLPGGNYIAQLYPEYGIDLGILKTPSREKVFRNNDPTRYGDGTTLSAAIKNPVESLISPIGGGMQFKKTKRAAGDLLRGYAVDSKGEKTFDVERSPENIAKGLLFGRNAFSEADEYYNPQAVNIDAKGTEGFTYSSTKRTLTVADGLQSREVVLTGDDLQKFEEARFAEYERLYKQAESGGVVLQNPYSAKTAAQNKKRVAQNKAMGRYLDKLYAQGAITRQQRRTIYNQYASGKSVTVRGVEHIAPVSVKRKKDYSQLTPEQQKAFRDKALSYYKSGALTRTEYESVLRIIKNRSGTVEVSEYITGDFSKLDGEEKKKIISKLNSLATEKAKSDWLDKTE